MSSLSEHLPRQQLPRQHEPSDASPMVSTLQTLNPDSCHVIRKPCGWAILGAQTDMQTDLDTSDASPMVYTYYIAYLKDAFS